MRIDVIVNTTARLHRREAPLLDEMRRAPPGVAEVHPTRVLERARRRCAPHRGARHRSRGALGRRRQLHGRRDGARALLRRDRCPRSRSCPGGTVATVARNWGDRGGDPARPARAAPRAPARSPSRRRGRRCACVPSSAAARVERARSASSSAPASSRGSSISTTPTARAGYARRGADRGAHLRRVVLGRRRTRAGARSHAVHHRGRGPRARPRGVVAGVRRGGAGPRPPHAGDLPRRRGPVAPHLVASPLPPRSARPARAAGPARQAHRRRGRTSTISCATFVGALLPGAAGPTCSTATCSAPRRSRSPRARPSTSSRSTSLIVTRSAASAFSSGGAPFRAGAFGTILRGRPFFDAIVCAPRPVAVVATFADPSRAAAAPASSRLHEPSRAIVTKSESVTMPSSRWSSSTTGKQPILSVSIKSAASAASSSGLAVSTVPRMTSRTLVLRFRSSASSAAGFVRIDSEAARMSRCDKRPTSTSPSSTGR